MFDWLPTVNSCCECCSLKVGSIIIALIGMTGLYSIASLLFFLPLCGSKTGVLQDVVTYINYVNAGVTILLMLISLILLIAVCMERFSAIATLFLLAVVLFLIVQLVTMIAAIVAIIIDSDCDPLHPFYVGILAYPVWFYFMMVVRTYRGEMV